MLIGALVVAGCGGGGGAGGSAMPGAPGTGPLPAGSLVVQGTIAGTGPQLLAHRRRPAAVRAGQATRSPQANVFAHILVTGTLFPGDKADTPISNSVTIPPPSGAFTASVPFSNVPAGNNEWVVLQFTGVAADGSTIALGELAGLVNVSGTATNSATLTASTTQTFQVFSLLASAGQIGTFDLDNTPALQSNLTTSIAAQHLTPDPTTQLFTQQQLGTLYAAIAPGFERAYAVTGTSGAFVILRNYTNTAELNLTSNLATQFSTLPFAVPFPTVAQAIGTALNCGFVFSGQPVHVPPNQVPVPSEVTSCIVPETGPQTIRNVYGGNVLIGSTNNTFASNPFLPVSPPFNGGFVAQAGHAAGTTTPVTVSTASTLMNVKVNDPAAFAFGAQFYATQPPFTGAFFVRPGFTDLMSATAFSTNLGAGSRVSVPTPFSATSNTLGVDTFNPWNIATANLQFCGGLTCVPLSATQPIAIAREFADAGNKLTFFAWKTGGTATGITQNTTGGYHVTVSGAGTGTLTTTTQTFFAPRQTVLISQTLSPPSGWKVDVTDTSANVFEGSATGSFGSVSIPMMSIGNRLTATKVVISFGTSVPGSFDIQTITGS